MLDMETRVQPWYHAGQKSLPSRDETASRTRTRGKSPPRRISRDHGRRTGGKRHDLPQYQASPWDSGTGRHAREERQRSPPPSYASLHPTHVALPASATDSGSDDQYPSTEESSDRRRRNISANRRRRSRQARSQIPRTRVETQQHRSSCGYSTDSAGYLRGQDSDSDVSEAELYEDRRRRGPERRKSSSMQHRRRCPSGMISIYEERPNRRDSEVNAPEYVIHEGARPTLAQWRLETKDGCFDYQLLPVVTENDAKEYLVKHSKKKFGYGTKAAKKCEITKVDPHCVFRYTLQTVTEARLVEKKTEVYTGQKVDGPKNGMAPDMWEIPIRRPNGYHDEVRRHRIGHTSVVKTCKSCDGSGKNCCSRCNGVGCRVCDHCHGGGYEESNRYQPNVAYDPSYRIPCHHCPGNGKLQCCNCGGCGNIRCDKCAGNGRVVQYDELVVTWRTISDGYVDDCQRIPKKQFSTAKGEVVFKDEARQLEHIHTKDLLHEKIRHLSKLYLERHNSIHLKKLKQRHIVDLVPVNEVQYQYRDNAYKFFLIGLDRRVYAPDYPHKHCWGCCVM